MNSRQNVVQPLFNRIGGRWPLPHDGLRVHGNLVSAIERRIDGMEAEGAIGFELLLAEQLVQRRLVRKCRVASLVVNDIVVFIAGKR
jgi:hypothetical protein